jgi:hypothetical protein
MACWWSFASVVDAVRCAVAVQQTMPQREASVGADSRIELRIGINLGDVIVEDDDLYRGGINIFVCHRSGANEPGYASLPAQRCSRAAASAASKIGKLATSSSICRSGCLLRS